MREQYFNFLKKNGYFTGLIINFICYSLVYKFLGINWVIISGITFLNTDIEWGNIINLTKKE